jgi:RimJ/RimL family protein N-acetyltransferase
MQKSTAMPSPHPSRLKTDRLILRPWRGDDGPPFAAMSADPEVMAHLLAFPSPEAVNSWITRQQAHLATHGFCLWAIESQDTGEFMGAAGLLRIGYDAHFTPAVEVGWRLAHRFWGKGYAPEAASAAISFGFDRLGLQEIVANTAPQNGNSRRVMEKLGMSYDPADDFDHPLMHADSPLRKQVLYRLPRERWSKRSKTSTSS